MGTGVGGLCSGEGVVGMGELYSLNEGAQIWSCFGKSLGQCMVWVFVWFLFVQYWELNPRSCNKVVPWSQDLCTFFNFILTPSPTKLPSPVQNSLCSSNWPQLTSLLPQLCDQKYCHTQPRWTPTSFSLNLIKHSDENPTEPTLCAPGQLLFSAVISPLLLVT